MVDELERRDQEAPLPPRLVVRKKDQSLEQQVRYLGPAWIDETADAPAAPYGFGADVARARRAREQFLRAQGIDLEPKARLAALGALERRAVGEALAHKQPGRQFLDRTPAPLRGKVELTEPLPNGKQFAQVVDRDGRFVLVSASPELRAMKDKTAEITRDKQGRLQVRALERDRGR